MGGYGSGRRGSRPTVESSFRIELSKLRRSGFLQPGSDTSTVWSWHNNYGEHTGSVRLRCNMAGQFGAELEISCSIDGSPMFQRITLEFAPMRFGGRRWYARCPDSGRRCTVLALPNGGRHFASAKAWRLPYASQSEDCIGRAHRRIAKAERRLERLSKYTRMKTRERLWNRIADAHEVLDYGTAVLLDRLLRRDRRLRAQK